MVPSMTSKGSDANKAVEDGNKTGEPDLMTSSGPSFVEQIQTSAFEAQLIAAAKPLVTDSETRWMDARGKYPAKPADFGDHKPIPEDTIIALPVEAKPRKTRSCVWTSWLEGKEKGHEA